MDTPVFIKPLRFNGSEYKIAHVNTFQCHPSWYSFQDESDVRERSWTYIRPGDKILDVGAAYGSYALTALAQEAAFVYAWSPQGHPGEQYSEADLFEQSLMLNGWSNRANIMRSGVFDRSGWLNTMTQEFSIEEPAKDPDIIKVDKLDDWFETVKSELVGSRVWMKLDVEGAEVGVLVGAKNLIDQVKPVAILVENHEFKDAQIANKVNALLATYGYKETERVPYHSISHSVYKRL